MKRSTGTSKKKKIIVVDDDRAFLNEIEEVLTSNGYKVHAFEDGQTALRKSVRIEPDIILTDLKLPVKSGFQVAEEFRKSPVTAGVPVIAMTGHYTEREHQILIRVCGLKDVLIKPLDPDELLARIERELQGNRGNPNPA